MRNNKITATRSYFEIIKLLTNVNIVEGGKILLFKPNIFYAGIKRSTRVQVI